MEKEKFLDQQELQQAQVETGKKLIIPPLLSLVTPPVPLVIPPVPSPGQGTPRDTPCMVQNVQVHHQLTPVHATAAPVASGQGALTPSVQSFIMSRPSPTPGTPRQGTPQTPFGGITALSSPAPKSDSFQLRWSVSEP